MDCQPDETLVREALAGRAEAFADLVRRYQGYAYGSAIAMLSDFDLARDVVQEAFLAAWRDLGKLRDPARFGGWLHGIVHNTARRALRELARVRALAGELGAAAGRPDPTPRPDESAMDTERRQIVRDALARLGRANREALSLFYVNGLSYANIAGYLGVTEATVLGRLQRGRAELKKELLAMVEDSFRKERLPEDFGPQVRRLLETAGAEVCRRDEAVRQLAEIGAPAVDPLCEAMGDPRALIRRLAAGALCRIGDARALRPVLRALYAGDYWLYNTVFRGGGILRIDGAREEILKIASESGGDDQYWAIEALGHAEGDPQVWDCLLGLFRDAAGNAKTRSAALGALCRLRPELADELVVEALRDPALRRLSGWAWWIAFKNGLAPPLDVCLAGFARDVAPHGRPTAGNLALRHGKAGIGALGYLLHSGSPVQQEAAALALARAGRAEAFEVLVGRLQHGGQETKWGRILARQLVRTFTEGKLGTRPSTTARLWLKGSDGIRR